MPRAVNRQRQAEYSTQVGSGHTCNRRQAVVACSQANRCFYFLQDLCVYGQGKHHLFYFPRYVGKKFFPHSLELAPELCFLFQTNSFSNFLTKQGKYIYDLVYKFLKVHVSPSANPLENIGSVYLLYVYDCNRPLAPLLRQKMVLSGVLCLMTADV
jgi:hypothetical protein